MFRLLRENEIEIRHATIKKDGISLLLYKDARCDMNILDETVGVFGWQRQHSRDNANCTVSIWNDTLKQWISKEDTGVESFTEKEKGLASDSFKRACFNWGIGRELYTSPFIYIPASKCNIYIDEGIYNPKDKGKAKTKDKFTVEKIAYNEDKKIIGLSIINQDKKRVFVYSEARDNENCKS